MYSTMFWTLILSLLLTLAASARSEMTIPHDEEDYGLADDEDYGLAGRLLAGNITLSPTSLSSYSVKFQGCWYEHVWNPRFPDSQSNPIVVERYVRYRLCPRSTNHQSGCSNHKAVGCTGKFGDYIVPLSVYASAELTFLYGPSSSSLLASDLQYLSCKEVPTTSSSSSKLFIGPSCSKQGGDISLSLYSDSTCSVPSDLSLSSYLSSPSAASLPSSALLSVGLTLDVASSLPSSQDLATTSCRSCSSSSSLCGDLYARSGRCERGSSSGSSSGVLQNDKSFCDYIDAISILRTDGSYDVSVLNKGSGSAGAFVGIFTALAVVLTAYAVHIRRTELKRSVNLDQMGLS